MLPPFAEFGINAGYVEDLHARYLQSREAVPENWRDFFDEREGFRTPNGGATSNGANGANGHGAVARGSSDTNGSANGHARSAAPAPTFLPDDSLLEAAAHQGRVYQLVNAYRVRGHLFAHVDPLGNPPPAAPELELANFGFTQADLDVTFPTVGVAGLPEKATLREVIAHLEETYCRAIGVEFTQIENPDMRLWLQERMESSRNRCSFDRQGLLHILRKLTDAEIFEQFIHKNYLGAKRFSLEGAESMIAMLDLLIESAGTHGVQEIVIGMAHRGRLNVLVNILGKNARDLFAAFEDKQPERFLGTGDVKYHLGYSSDRLTASGAKVHLTLAFNPSHLEWVNPVVEGRTRAKQDRGKRHGVMPLLIHGDAAFMGQGVVPETLNLAGLEGYSTGGTIHLVVNNQVGFTTNPKDARSTRYCTDITRMMRVPVFHVNGEDPEAVIQVTQLATEFRQKFGKDVVIDMYCYRKYGHNETDEPRYTQPQMYTLIDAKPSVREMYVQRLVELKELTDAEANAIVDERRAALDQAREEAKTGDFNKMPEAMGGLWAAYKGGPDKAVPEVDTSVSTEKLTFLAERLSTFPADFTVNPKVIKTVVEPRMQKFASGKGLDWGAAEHLALASLLDEGVPIRFTGQDVRRGTFSHRHAVMVDPRTGVSYSPLAHLGPNAGRFDIFDSPLSEAGVLGFEYGYSLDYPDGLVVWEAQFGDFGNTAQVIVDQFLVSAEDKWKRLSGMVLLLPHGYEGQGPEHSSARIERFLQLAAEDNIQVMNLTTPAQFFHALRRQVHRPIRKPMVVFSPKSLLRHPDATSTVDDLTSGRFHHVLGDTTVDPKKVKKVLLSFGKVHYDLAKARTERKRDDVALVRVEQIYPFSDALAEAVAPYANAQFRWVQDEPLNMGAWYFVNARRKEMFGRDVNLDVACRVESASPATGSNAAHQLEQKMLMDAAFAD
ncbi:MAG: 2-oxoglutarate dehydrogenase E1 component [Polyangiaceae bacterium]